MCRPCKRTSITRRRVLATGGVAMLTSTVGCTRILNAVGERIFEDVNTLNQLGREVSGPVGVVGLSGETVFNTMFNALSTETDGDSNTITYADV